MEQASFLKLPCKETQKSKIVLIMLVEGTGRLFTLFTAVVIR